MLDLLSSPSRSLRTKARSPSVSPPVTPAKMRPLAGADESAVPQPVPALDTDSPAAPSSMAMLSPPYTPDRRRSLNPLASFNIRSLVKFNKPKSSTREPAPPLTPDPSPARQARPGNPVCGVSSNDGQMAEDAPLLRSPERTPSPRSDASSPPCVEDAPPPKCPPGSSKRAHDPAAQVNSVSLSSPVSIVSPRIVWSTSSDTEPESPLAFADVASLESEPEHVLSPGAPPCTPKLSPAGSADSPASVDTPTPQRAPMRRLGSTYSDHFSPQHVLCDEFLAKYALDGEIGAGGYGFVLTARVRETDVEVAIKFVLKSQLGPEQWTYDPQRRRCVPLEVYLLQTLDHPGIISCLDAYEDEIYFYMVLELHGSPWSKQMSPRPAERGDSPRKADAYPNLDDVDGEWQDLHGPREATEIVLPSYLKLNPQLNVHRPGLCFRRPSQDLFECIEHNPLCEDEAKYVFAQVVDAVRYLHDHGVVHRDIKDENILVDHNLRIKLIDFGSAVQEDLNLPAPVYTVFYGTPVYAASEILNHFPFYAAPAEIWTLGILLCNIVWGCSPFADHESARIGAVHLPRFIPNARWRESSTAESIGTCISLVNWCLHPSPARRPTIDGVANHPWLRDAFPIEYRDGAA